MNKLWVILSIVLLSSCAGVGPFVQDKSYVPEQNNIQEADIEQRVILIGDAGKPSAKKTEPTLAMAKSIWKDDGTAVVVYLGDNIYPLGMPDRSTPEYAETERRISEQLKAGNPGKDRTYFIGGNHDWDRGHEEGWANALRQEAFVDSVLGYNGFIPDGGCPGPDVEKVGDDIALIMINTQWWLHKGDRPEGDGGGCEDVKNEEEFLVQLKEAIRDNRDRQIILLGHHPLVSNGSHGGYYTWKDHLFPLTEKIKWLYLPLPVIGSIYPGYRKYLGNVQDLAHPKYQLLIEGIKDVLYENSGVVYVAGHEHNLQYHDRGSYHHIVSGSGSKTTKVASGKGSEFAYAAKGIVELLHLKNGEIWVRFKVPDTNLPKGRVVFEKKLGVHEERHDRDKTLTANSGIDYTDSTIVVVASDVYRSSKFHRKLMGAQYRDVWSAPVEVSVLDLYEQDGGLTPIKRGGGMATKSLRFEAGDGHQYVVRSIQKDPSSVLPSYLRKTFAMGIIQDGIAASHPYAAITVPPMSDAVGVLHSDPKIKYVPKDVALGDFQESFGDLLSLYEKRPSGDQSDEPHFGNATKLIGTPDLLHKLRASHYEVIDEEALLVARLFDNVLGDWDRHDDQWRWARYSTEKGHSYVPVPRDRDQVFHKFEGLMPSLANSSWAARNLRNFDYEVDDIIGQNFNARYLDRSFLTEMDRADFIKAAQHIQAKLTDEVIHEAIMLFPDTIYALTGEEIEAKLRSRRERIVEQGQDYYEVLAKEVDIVGSELDEQFEIVRMNNEETSITMLPIVNGKIDQSDTLYHRVFLRSETKEIRIYGIGGNDVFHTSGEVKKGILLRLICGVNDTRMATEDRVKGMRRMTKVYSAGSKLRRGKVSWPEEKPKEVKDHIDKIAQDASYDRKSFMYNTTLPLVGLGYNVDDGLFVGGGFIHTHHGFLKDPYKSKQTLLAKVAFLTGSWSFLYIGDHRKVFGNWDFHNEIHVDAPNFLFNFYGQGNESTRDIGEDPGFYRFKMDQIRYFPALKRSWNEAAKFLIGPTYQYVDPRANRDRFADQDETLVNDVFDLRHFVGAKAVYELENVDNKMIPKRGLRFNTEIAYNKGITVAETEYTKAKAELALYIPLEFLPEGMTIAVRAGGSHIIGDYEVYQASALGGYKEFRGIRRDRYNGRSSAYGNSDLRFRIARIRSGFIPFDLGGLAHYDIGRVWLDGEESDQWHNSYGFGAWVGILDKVAIRGVWSKSDDDELFVLGLGFFY